MNTYIYIYTHTHFKRSFRIEGWDLNNTKIEDLKARVLNGRIPLRFSEDEAHS